MLYQGKLIQNEWGGLKNIKNFVKGFWWIFIKSLNAPKKLSKNRLFYIFTNRIVLSIIYVGKLTAARQTDYLVKYQSNDMLVHKDNALLCFFFFCLCWFYILNILNIVFNHFWCTLCQNTQKCFFFLPFLLTLHN